MAARKGEFEADRRHQSVPSGLPCRRVLYGDMVAEFIRDRRSDPEIVHCVVQRLGSPDVLLLEQFYSQAEAERVAKKFMVSYKNWRAKAA